MYKYDGQNVKKTGFFVIHYIVMIIEFIRSFHKFCNSESTCFLMEMNVGIYFQALE